MRTRIQIVTMYWMEMVDAEIDPRWFRATSVQ